jgi:hypothetical protein
MRARASHPRTFLMLCILTMIIILVAYSILILFPSYQSGVYNSTDPTSNRYTVPWYTTSLFVGYDSWLFNSAMFTIIGAWCFVPPLSLAFLSVLVLRRRTLSLSETRWWIGTLLGLWSFLLITFPAAWNFLGWLIPD